MKKWRTILNSLLFFVAVSMLANCTKKEETECEGAVCTKESRLFSIKTVNTLREPVKPETLQIIDMQTGKIIKNYTQNIGSQFAILGDEDMSLLPLENVQYSFMIKAIKNNVTTDEITTIFSKDCCHINLLSGNTEMIIYQ